MKKNNILKSGLIFLSGIITATSASVFAQQVEKTINVSYKDIKIYTDGNLINTDDDKEAFIYNGTTYLPVRMVGEAFGKNIEWDGDTNSIYIGAKNDTVITDTSESSDLSEYEFSAYSRILLEASLNRNSNYTINSYQNAVDKKSGERAIVINYSENGKRMYAYVRIREGEATSDSMITIYQMSISSMPNKHLNLNTFNSLVYLTNAADLGDNISINEVNSYYNALKDGNNYNIIS